MSTDIARRSSITGMLLVGVLFVCHPAAATTRTIVILGSSTAEGGGASSYARSWAGRLTAALTVQGYAVRNASISGSNTGDSLQRFDRDVSPYEPEFVLLATSIVNEPGAIAVPQYVQNTLLLIRKAEAIGATPVLALPYPNNGFSESMYLSVKAIYRQLGSEGVPVLNFLDAADDGRGHWIPGLDTDGTHPTDLGHQLLFESIPLTMFSALAHPQSPPNPHGYGSWVQRTPQDRDGALEIHGTTPLSSWTVSLWFKPSDSGTERVLAAIDGDEIQMRRNRDELRLYGRGDRLATVETERSTRFRHVAITYQSMTNSLRLYLDGCKVADLRVAAAAARVFSVGGVLRAPGLNATDDQFADFILYRTPLSPESVGDIAASRPPWTSVEAWLPLTYSPSRPVLNRAMTAMTTVVNGTWLWSGDGISPVHRMRITGSR